MGEDVVTIGHAVGGSAAALRVAGSRVLLSGAWTVTGLSDLESVLPRVAWPSAGELEVDASGISRMDTGGAWLLLRTLRGAEARGLRVSLRGLDADMQALVDLLRAVAPGAAVPRAPRPDPLVRLGAVTVSAASATLRLLTFLGEAALAALRTLRHLGRLRVRPVLYNIRTAGFDALPITGLLCFLMGLVIAYQGATQLERYGADIFVADLVGLAMLRELSPLLTAIIVAGRSGSAYAAQIGTMKVTDEVDALRTVGIAPMDLLVLPKLLALAIALPLLTVYADVLGVAGGMLMAEAELDVSHVDFLDRLQRALRPSDFLVGIGKAPIFAGIIAAVGCYQGLRVSGDAESVGRRTTVSVVQSIFFVIVTDAVFSVVFNRLGI